MADDRRNSTQHRAALALPSLTTCPITLGEVGLWNNSGALKVRKADGTDIAYADLSALDYAEAGDMAAAGNAAANAAGTSDEVSRGDHVHAQGKMVAAATALAVTDPGDAGAVAVTHSGVCNLTTGASGETRTVADPAFIGQELVLSLAVDGGGDAAITFASDFDQSGNNVMTFGDAGDMAKFVATLIGANRKWRLICNLGGAAS